MKSNLSDDLNQYLLTKLNGDTKALKVLDVLFEHADPKTKSVSLSANDLSKMCGFSRSAAAEKVVKLTAADCIERVQDCQTFTRGRPAIGIKLNIYDTLFYRNFTRLLPKGEFVQILDWQKSGVNKDSKDGGLGAILQEALDYIDSPFLKRFIKELSPTEMVSPNGDVAMSPPPSATSPSATANASLNFSNSNDSEQQEPEVITPFLGNEDYLTTASLQRANGEAVRQNSVEPPAANIEPNRDLRGGVDDQTCGVTVNGVLCAEQEPTNDLPKKSSDKPAKKSTKKSSKKTATRKTSKKAETEAKQEAERNKNTVVWEAYLEAFRLRYPHNPDPLRGARINARIKSLLTAFDFEVTLNLVRYYLQSNDSFYIRNVHHLTCLTDAQWHTLYMEMESGNKVTRQDARSMELVQNNAAVVERYLAKKHARQREARQV